MESEKEDNKNNKSKNKEPPIKKFSKRKRSKSQDSNDSYTPEGIKFHKKTYQEKFENDTQDIKYTDVDQDSRYSSSNSSSGSSSYSSSSYSESDSNSSDNENNIDSTNNKRLKNYDEDEIWKIYETQNCKKDLKGKTKFYMDWTKGKKPEVPKFRVKNLPEDFPKNPTPYDCFSLFFNDKLWQHIANQTNLYAAQQRKL